MRFTPLPNDPQAARYRAIDQFRLSDLEAVRLVLRGGSVIDWHRLNFDTREEAVEFIAAQEFDLDNQEELDRIEAVKVEAIDYLRRNFDFPIPKPVATLDLAGLLMLASGKGHRQVCACAILKAMHIIHHLESRELLFMLPVSNQEVFYMVEEKVYRVVGSMLASGFPILEFIGGRKHKDSLYTKLLSKPETVAANIYDKLRFRIVTRSPDDIFPTLNYMLGHVFPFNYVIPGQSTNTMFHFRSYCEQHPHLSTLFKDLQLDPDLEDDLIRLENRFTAESYSVVHFVVDMPVRAPRDIIQRAPKSAHHLGPVIFVQAEFQILDRDTEQRNERGDASHAAYKERQRNAVRHRLKVGIDTVRPPKKG
ncbi:MAG: TIGR04552 family protein [Myxococcales bacterium]|nr:TIGR04552 family protein [Myxococcales bacterium]